MFWAMLVDRGPHPIKVLHKLMEMPNAFCLVGNHELMAIRCLEFLMQEITEDSIEHMNEGMIQGISEWQMKWKQHNHAGVSDIEQGRTGRCS